MIHVAKTALLLAIEFFDLLARPDHDAAHILEFDNSKTLSMIQLTYYTFEKLLNSPMAILEEELR